MLIVLRGFAHGFLSLEDNTQMMYQCEGAYDSATDTGIRFDDPDINIKWPVENLDECIHSKRDLKLGFFSDMNEEIIKKFCDL